MITIAHAAKLYSKLDPAEQFSVSYRYML